MKFLFISIICCTLSISCFFHSWAENAYLLVTDESSYSIEWVSTAQSPSDYFLYYMYYEPAVLICNSDVVSQYEKKQWRIEDLCANIEEAEICAYTVIDGERILLKRWKGADRLLDKHTPFCLNHCTIDTGYGVDGSHYIVYYFHATDEDFEEVIQAKEL